MNNRIINAEDQETVNTQEDEYEDCAALVERFVHTRGDSGATDAEKQLVHDWGIKAIVQRCLFEMVVDGLVDIGVSRDGDVVFNRNDCVSPEDLRDGGSPTVH